MTVRVFLTNNNNQEFLETCLKALLAQDYKNFRVTFIDNGSVDDSVSFVKENFPNVEVVHNINNIGDYKAINDLVITTAEEYIAIVKPDAVVETDWLREMITVISADSNIFSVSPTVLYQHNPVKVKQAGMGFTLGGTAFPLYSGKNVNKIKMKNVFASGDCGVLFRKKLFQNLNGFDEKYFSIGGELDISWKARKQGYKNVICPTAFLVRLSEGCLMDNDSRSRLEARNNYWSIYKNSPAWQKFLTGWMVGWGTSCRKRQAKSSRKAFKQGVIEGKATAKRLCKKQGSAFGKNVKNATAQFKYTFVNFVRFPKS